MVGGRGCIALSEESADGDRLVGGRANEDLLTLLRREFTSVKGSWAAIHQDLATVIAQRAERFAGRTSKADPAASLIHWLLRA